MTNNESDEEEKSRKDEQLHTELLHNILVKDIENVDEGNTALSQRCLDVDPLKCFTIVSRTLHDGCFHFDFECVSTKQQEAIVFALRSVCDTGEHRSFRMRRRSLPTFRGHSSTQVHPDALDLTVTPDAVLSPLQRTCIYPNSGSMEEGTELALNHADEIDNVGIAVAVPRRRSAPTDPFSFAEVSGNQSLDEQQDALESSTSMLAASFQEALDEWCSDDKCIDLTELAESLEGIFFMVENQKQAEASTYIGNHGQHVRADSSSEMQVASLCMTDFLNTPSAIWADLPSPSGSDDKNTSSTLSTRKLLNRSRVANAQAHRWQQLRNEMTFESVERSDTLFMPSIETTKSFDDLYGTDARVASSQRIASGKFTDTSGYGLFELFPSGLWEEANDPTESEECYFYDSEPDCSRLYTHKKGPRRISAELLNKVTTEEVKKSQRLNFSLPRHLGSHFDDEYASAIIDVSICTRACQTFCVTRFFACAQTSFNALFICRS